MRKPAKRHDVVLLVEDHDLTRALLSRRLERLGFRVLAVDSFEAGLKEFEAGFVDIVIADWDLASDQRKKGDALFLAIRKRDWEVPLVLVSGKLTEDRQRAATLARLLRCGSTAFVDRGEGYSKIIKAARALLARRDVALADMIHKLRSIRESIPTTSGPADSRKLLAHLLSDMRWKKGTLAPLAKEFADWEAIRRQRRRS